MASRLSNALIEDSILYSIIGDMFNGAYIRTSSGIFALYERFAGGESCGMQLRKVEESEVSNYFLHQLGVIDSVEMERRDAILDEECKRKLEKEEYERYLKLKDKFEPRQVTNHDDNKIG